MLSQPLERSIGVPSLVTVSVATIVLLGWFVVYGVTVWTQSAHDKKELEAKEAEAMAQLFANEQAI